jgi:hypothetical protein
MVTVNGMVGRERGGRGEGRERRYVLVPDKLTVEFSLTPYLIASHNSFHLCVLKTVS